MKKNILVDLDGTLLIANHRFLLVASALFLLRRFIPIFGRRSFTIIRQAVKTMMSNTIATGMTNFEVLINELERNSGKPKNLFIDRVEKFYLVDFPKLRRACRPVNGVALCLRDLKAKGYQLFLATNPIWPASAIRLRLSWAGVSPELFSGITHSENWHSCKPTENYYAEILQEWKLRPHETLMVGDSELKDGPARNLGVDVSLVPPSNQSEFWQKWAGSLPDLSMSLKLQGQNADTSAWQNQ